MPAESTGHQAALRDAIRAACSKIAPVWPLDSFVAVNPYLGMSDMRFDDVAQRLRDVAGAQMTMPGQHYLDALDGGELTLADIAAALDARNCDESAGPFVARARALFRQPATPAARVDSVADIAARETQRDWVRFAAESIGLFAACYFDGGQALWRSPFRGEGLYAAWRAEARVDRTPETMGIAGFRDTVARLPESHEAAASLVLQGLGVPGAALDRYLHRVLMRSGGWAAYAACIVWKRRLQAAEHDDVLEQFLAVLLAWEWALYTAFADQGVESAWGAARARLAREGEAPDQDDALDAALTLQAARERAVQRNLCSTLHAQAAQTVPAPTPARPAAQAVFCIDVRSEVFRHHLETVNPAIETLGFAGFFGFPVQFVPLGHESGAAQCPVLLSPAHEVHETVTGHGGPHAASDMRRRRHEVQRAWYGFKMGAISCFSFVGAIGLAYLPKLFSDAFGLTRPLPEPMAEGIPAEAGAARGIDLTPGSCAGRPTGIPLDSRIALAAGALQAMSLTEGFGRFILIVGHGATMVNNPHATGYDCGACGGHSGEANARVAADVLNDADVRAALQGRGIHIPLDTVFLACLHDTTTDLVAILNPGAVPNAQRRHLVQIEENLAQAGRLCRAERAGRFALAPGDDPAATILARSRDWAQVRPEWGLAGCAAFIAAPRHRTRGINLEGRAFLHSYQWQRDEGFAVLELIMTAPMVVASWISLQYYASTVDNRIFGCGNKTLHNVTGTVGVVEGNGGDLRVGLPWQAVHDGQAWQHDAVRLNVFIEAPVEAMNEIIARNESVRQLVDNQWLHLFAIDTAGRVTRRYAGGLRWTACEAPAELAAAGGLA
jgi:uncharacterized protein YbcC (UPF0753/DUF2309 family)